MSLWVKARYAEDGVWDNLPYLRSALTDGAQDYTRAELDDW